MCNCENCNGSQISMRPNPKRKRFAFGSRLPFVYSITTTEEGRAYQFKTPGKQDFELAVKFPYDGENMLPPLIINADNVSPRDLQEAIEFVTSNEQNFIDVFSVQKFQQERKENGDQDDYQPLLVGEAAFKKLQVGE